MNRADAIIAVTQAAASYLDRCDAIVGHGVDTSEFVPPANRSDAWRASGLPGTIGVGIFGRVRRSKGTDLFVEAMCQVLPRHPEVTAVITGQTKDGDRSFREQLEQRIAEARLEERIVFLGDLSFPEIKGWYQKVSLCVAVPRSEGFGLTPLEAMASGAPALTSSEGCFPDLIVDDVNGRRIKTGDLKELVEALEHLLSNPLRLGEMGAAARDIVEARWGIEAEVEGIHEVYEEARRRC